MRNYCLVALAALLIVCGCATSTDDHGDPIAMEVRVGGDSEVVSPALSVDKFIGSYATVDYARRAEGYDWVGITIEKIHDQEAYVQIRARGDRKRPTCTFDGVGFLAEEGRLDVAVDGKIIALELAGDTLTIATPDPKNEGLLYFYCSGGASLADVYQRIEGPLDASQLQADAFSRVLALQGIQFTITATGDRPMNTVRIQPKGLEIDNRLIVQQVEGTITGAEIEDLNADGWPELLIYTQSVGSGSYGTVLGYSVNNGKSVSSIAVPELDEAMTAGYMGHDEFGIVETSLVRRFRVYNDGDSNAQPTGPTRQIEYKLVDGEASRGFKIKSVVEIPIP